VSRSVRLMHALLEGQTEEVIVKNTFQPHWQEQGWLTEWSILKSHRQSRGRPAYRGGVSTWAKIEHEIRLLLRNPTLDLLTMIVDYYAFPADAPGMASRPPGTAWQRIAHVEAALAERIDDPRFLPHLTLHETETWVYAAADELGELFDMPELARVLQAEAAAAGGPEGINDGVDTAPSKRLGKYWPTYSKTLDGPLVIDSLGVCALRKRCPHLDAWLIEIERRATG
jgi:hypothetical protein